MAFCASGLFAQEAPPDTTRPAEPPPSDTVKFTPPALRDMPAPDTLKPVPPSIDTIEAEADTAAAADTISLSIYQAREYICTGPAEEIKGLPSYFLSQPGPIGSPAIPFYNLNAVGAAFSLNGLPFTYNGIYRPYVIGVDLNTIPWEILNGIEASPRESYPGLNFIIGPPADRINRSDIEVARGPYGYSGTRWRFFRPFGKKTYAYFTLGFKKSGGYITNTDYDGHHVTGGLVRKLAGGELQLDLWTHRARSGLLSLDFATPQQSRQSRTLTRSELRFNRALTGPFYLRLTGFYHRTDQTITGYGSRLSNKYDIGGGEALVTDSLPGTTLVFGAGYHRSLLYGLAGSSPRADHFSARSGIENNDDRLHYSIGLAYEWNRIDGSALLPSAKLTFGMSERFRPYAMAFRARGVPDLYIRNLRDNVPSTGAPEVIRSYTFAPDPNLDTPLLSQLTIGAEVEGGRSGFDIGLSYKRIDSEIFTTYVLDSERNLTLSPRNFDDAYVELLGVGDAGLWIFDGKIGGSLKFWNEKNMPDGVEKGPMALGFGKLSFRREIFIPRLFIGGSLEGRFSSRRDFRSITGGSDDAFAAFDGRLEFQYKDFVFWLNDENLLNENYITWWPYYESARIVWWGFRWSFFD